MYHGKVHIEQFFEQKNIHIITTIDSLLTSVFSL